MCGGSRFNMIMAFAMLVSGGGIVVISRDLGSKNHEHAKMVASLCTWSAVIFGIVLGVVIILFNGPITSFLTDRSLLFWERLRISKLMREHIW